MNEKVEMTGNRCGVLVLPALRPRAVSLQIMLLLAAAFVLPAVAHALDVPVRVLLPMHWPVILAGLCYGWRSGAIIGLAAPGVSFLLSGMPPAIILPAMTAELAAYGFFAGFFRELLRRNRYVSVAGSLLGGRLVFVGLALATGALSEPLGGYLVSALLPGAGAAIGQLVLLPVLANRWVRHETKE